MGGEGGGEDEGGGEGEGRGESEGGGEGEGVRCHNPRRVMAVFSASMSSPPLLLACVFLALAAPIAATADKPLPHIVMHLVDDWVRPRGETSRCLCHRPWCRLPG